MTGAGDNDDDELPAAGDAPARPNDRDAAVAARADSALGPLTNDVERALASVHDAQNALAAVGDVERALAAAGDVERFLAAADDVERFSSAPVSRALLDGIVDAAT
ncbi:MAG TPA: hypothetical protein VIA18_24670, partial [Polyangia bacterium]|nr:hypothetical protein [Polyangia bacterium]